jgi:hypothetical protein
MPAWIAAANSEQADFYVDSVPIKRSGSHVVVWTLRDFHYSKLGAGGYFLSTKDELEINCASGYFRRIQTSDYSGQMGKGKLVRSEQGSMSWNAVTPDSVIQRMVGLACPQAKAR